MVWRTTEEDHSALCMFCPKQKFFLNYIDRNEEHRQMVASLFLEFTSLHFTNLHKVTETQRHPRNGSCLYCLIGLGWVALG